MKVLVLINMDGGVSEHLFSVTLGSNAHVFLTKRSHLSTNIGMFLQGEMSGSSSLLYLRAEDLDSRAVHSVTPF